MFFTILKFYNIQKTNEPACEHELVVRRQRVWRQKSLLRDGGRIRWSQNCPGNRSSGGKTTLRGRCHPFLGPERERFKVTLVSKMLITLQFVSVFFPNTISFSVFKMSFWNIYFIEVKKKSLSHTHTFFQFYIYFNSARAVENLISSRNLAASVLYCCSCCFCIEHYWAGGE